MDLLGTLIGDVLGARKKRHKGALSFLTGGRHPFLKTSLLLGGAGIAWQLLREAQARSAGPVSTTRVEPGGDPRPHSTTTVIGGAAGGAPQGGSQANRALVVTRLLVAAARVDGELSEEELAHLAAHAREAGLEQRMRAEWQSPRPLAEIAAAIQGDAERRDAYTLVYACLRADEDVNGAEAVFLAQLAHLLHLDPAATAELEHDAAERIDRAAKEDIE
jgi:uncharacterized membrane protein YebE (DUF533 family)